MLVKKSIVILFALAVLLSFPCCNSDRESPENASVGKTEADTGKDEASLLTPKSNDIVGWLWSGDEEDPIITEFIREYPDLNVDNSEPTEGIFGDRKVDLPRLSASIAAGKQPDLFFSWVPSVEAYYTNLFMPVQRFIDADNEFNLEEFDAQAFEETTFNGEIYFLPSAYTAQILGWNKNMFESVGLDPNKPPETWSEYMDYGLKLTTKDTDGSLKTIGIYQDHFRWDSWYIAATGEHFVDETGLNFKWDTPEYVKLMEYARSIEDIYGGRDKLGDGLWWIVFGNVGMGELSAGGLSFVAESSFEVGISVLPRPDDSDEFYLASNTESFLGIPKDAKNPAGGWMLLKYAVTDGRIAQELSTYHKAPGKYISQYIYHKPTRESLYESFEGLIEDKLIDFMKERDAIVAKCNRTYYKSPVHSDVMAYFNQNYPKMLDHSIAPQDFVNNLQAHCQQLITEFKEQKEEEFWVFEEGKDGIYVGKE